MGSTAEAGCKKIRRDRRYAVSERRPEATSEEVHELARVCAEKIMEMKPECVLCQGEFCLSYQVIQKLKKAGIKVVAACSERKTEEKKIGNDTRKVSYFIFVQFREY